MSQFDLQQAQNHERRNRIRNQSSNAKSKRSNTSNQMFEKLCKWSKYSKLRDSDRTNQESRKPVRSGSKPLRSGSSLRRVNSLSRRKDFTTRAEIQSHSQSGNFVFHRGFSLKRSKLPSLKGKHRNQAELASAMDYIDLRSMPRSDFTSARRFLYLKLKSPSFWQLLRLHPRFVFRTITADPNPMSGKVKSSYGATVPRKNSIRRVIPNAGRIRRANTYSGPYHQSSTHPKNKPLYDVWRDYLSHVISQRIELRLYLHDPISDVSASSEFATRSSKSTSLTTPSDEAYFPSHSSSSGATNDERSSFYENAMNDHMSLKTGSEVASVASAERNRSALQLRKAY
ncbi:Nis1p LALA0_S04e08306g [Lachancea lanzarotensis]|uniref:LALA0S04e08306g1_1 n=1 Tax=Lachancea lanzarotensis TaxID=1245769 RepID=A0A0C7MWV1_9SACH|nr:uncharacterized protein LALA0_S04e08306g [Lachancea lanzarotensis]CEP62121.1 LALA0S04e08306g1_1 [Lachancea lanzarotensis]